MTLPNHFQIHPNTGPAGINAAHLPAPVNLKGSADGEEVVLRLNSHSPSAHALEESTFALSQREKDLKQRRIKNRPLGKTSRANHAEFFHKKLPDLDKERLHEFFGQVKKERGTPDRLEKKARRFFKDVSHQYAALNWARQQLAKEKTDPQLAKALKKAESACLSRHGPDIQAGLNVSRTALEYSVKGFGELQSLRDLYRETITHAEGLEARFHSIFKKYNHREIPTAIEFLMTAAGCDLRSHRRSVSKAHLKSVIDELYWLKFLSGLHQSCTTLLQRMENQFGLVLGTTASKMLEKLFNFKKDPYLQSATIIKMADGLGISDNVAKIDFLRESCNIINTFPEKTFLDNTARQHMVRAFREAMDMAIDSELEGLN